MKKIFSLIVLVSSFSAVIGQKTINDADAEIREAKNFHGISVSSAFDVYLSQSNDEAVAVSASDAGTRSRIKVEVRDGILYVGLEKGKWNLSNKNLKAYISFKNLDKLSVSGSCDVYVDGIIKADDLKISLSGSSDIRQAKLDVKKLDVDLSGSSDMKVSGIAANLTIDVSGSSQFKGDNLVTDFCKANASGSSDISITVTKELSARTSGSSDVLVKGEGVIRDIKTSGSSRISKI
jgi:Putative auto-transporter adhesin, head GIN domain